MHICWERQISLGNLWHDSAFDKRFLYCLNMQSIVFFLTNKNKIENDEKLRNHSYSATAVMSVSFSSLQFFLPPLLLMKIGKL